jgi:hypothetical protein
MSFIVNFYQAYKRRKNRQTLPLDELVLHQFPRALRAPSASPFCLKLETWIRMANIKYTVNIILILYFIFCI